MGVDLETYRGRIGSFRVGCGLDVVTIECLVNFSHGMKTVGSVLFIGILLIMAGIESNPGPNPKPGTGQPHQMSQTTPQVQQGQSTEQRFQPHHQAQHVLPEGPMQPQQMSEPGVHVQQGQKPDQGPHSHKQRPLDKSRKTSSVPGCTIHDQELLRLLTKLELVERFPSKISLKDVIAIDTVSLDKKNMSFIPWIFLSQMISVNSDTRDNILAGVTIENREVKPFDMDSFLECDSDDDSLSDDISPFDVFLTVYQCCNPFLKQLLFRKFYMCKIAAPFIHVDDLSKPVLSVWPLRTLMIDERKRKHIESGSTDKETVSSRNVNILDLQTKVVTFARFGRPPISKSELLNSMLSDDGYSTFYNKECRSGMSERFVAKGYVEIFWLPSMAQMNDKFEETLSFLNMRGDIKRDFTAEYTKFIHNMSDGIFIIVDLEDLVNSFEELQSIVVQFQSVTLVLAGPLRSSDKERKKYLKQLNDTCKNTNTHLNIILTYEAETKLNNVDIVSRLTKVVNEKIKNDPKTFGQRLDSAGTGEVTSDEHDSGCISAKQAAFQLLEDMKCDMAKRQCPETVNVGWKHCITPSSFMLSGNLADIIKVVQMGSSDQTTEKLNQQIREIRRKQIDKTTTSIRNFIGFLINCKGARVYRTYFLVWLQILVDKETRVVLNSLNLRKQAALEKGIKLKAEGQQSTSEIDKQKSLLTKLDHEIEDSSFGAEHMFREIAHICDALLELKKKGEDVGLPPITEVADLFSDLLLNGHSFELVDGDHGLMSKLWVKEVFSALNKMLPEGKNKVMSLSVLGLQSSGKSTLLNTMFGLHFSVSTGRCTKGVHAQLVPIRHSGVDELPFQYVMVVDSEGLRAPELTETTKKNSRDNLLATFVTGLADMTVLNIMGENISEIQDVLQIIVHAFLRLKLANNALQIDQTCMFLHHNVTDKSARENMKDGMIKVVNLLDQVTHESASSEGISEITHFNQVIEFNINTHIFHLPNLWQGNVPMNRVNTGYSGGVARIKDRIIHIALGATNKSYKCLPDILIHANDLWRGVLSEDFVFSFRNSLEIKAYNNIQTKVNALKWELESFVRENMLRDLQKKFLGCSDKTQLESIRDSVIQNAILNLAGEEENTLKHVEKVFLESEYKDLVINWKARNVHRITECRNDLEVVIKLETNKYCEKRRIQIMTSFVTQDHKEKLRQKSFEVANELKGQNLNDTQIGAHFNVLWRQFESEIRSVAMTKSEVEMEKAFREILLAIFPNHKSILISELETRDIFRATKLCTLKGTLRLTGITIDDISVSRTLQNPFPTKQVPESHIEEMFTAVEQIIKSITGSGKEITKMEVNECIHQVIQVYEAMSRLAKSGDNLTFKATFEIKIHLHCCRFAYHYFEKHNVEYHKQHGVNAQIAHFKKEMKLSFDLQIKDRKEDERAAKLLCLGIERALKTIVCERVAVETQQRLFQSLPFKTKCTLLKTLCKDLMAMGQLRLFTQYIHYPENYAQKWVKKKAEEILFDKNVYSSIALDELKSIFGDVIRCVNECQKRFKTNGDEKNERKAWFNYFSDTLKSCKLSELHVDSFLNSKHLENVAFFTSILVPLLNEMKTRLEGEYRRVTKSSVAWEGACPFGLVFKRFWGCKEKCPFCGEPCALDESHDKSDHICIQHRPNCCKGTHCSRSKEGAIEVCNYFVHSDQEGYYCSVHDYICNPGKKENCPQTEHFYKDYKHYFKTWDIPPSCNLYECSKYWMWFVASYKNGLSERYGIKMSNVPVEWHSISETEAKESIDNCYGV